MAVAVACRVGDLRDEPAEQRGRLRVQRRHDELPGGPGPEPGRRQRDQARHGDLGADDEGQLEAEHDRRVDGQVPGALAGSSGG
jgi:hypothetical protein